MDTGTTQGSAWRLGHMLNDFADEQPGSTALIVGPERHSISYATLTHLVIDHCTALQRCGLGGGDVVALKSTNSIEFVVSLLAAARANLVVAPLDPGLPGAERRARADRVGARVVLTDARTPDPGGVEDCPEWRVQITPPPISSRCGPVMRLLESDSARENVSRVAGLTDRDALIMVTSGTTGASKLVPWTHENLAASIEGIAGAYQLSSSDSTVAAMPLFHGHGLVATLLATLATGGTVALPASGKFSASSFWSDVDAVNATWFTAVPTIHQILLDRFATDRRSGFGNRLRFVRSCSAPLPPATAKRIEATFGVPVLGAYGMTETTHQASSVLPSADENARANTVGVPTGLTVQIVDDEGRPSDLGDVGEIWLRGASVVRGYLDDASATSSTFANGWVRTGDLGSIDDHGNLTIRGRRKNLINRGGEKISPERVEEVLLSHPGVAQAAVFGVPDDLYGERVAAYVVQSNGTKVDAAELVNFSRQRLAAFEIPELITVTDRLPLTAKGSVDRQKLQSQTITGTKAGIVHAVSAT